MWSFDRQAIFGPGQTRWDSNFLIPGAAVPADDVLHLFYVGYDVDGNSIKRGGVGYAMSSDGRDWVRVVEEPLFDGAELPWTDVGVVPGSAIVLDDGTWVMYFNTVPRTLGSRGGVIGRATAPRPEGPWTIDPEPVLTPGSEGEWDWKGLTHPSVVRTDDSFVMWFDGQIDDTDSDPSREIGMATSPDGITWTKHDDPATTEPPHAESDPVFSFGAEGEWDALRVQHPSVVQTDEGFVMTYTSTRRNPNEPGRVWEFGYATSDDGISWERDPANPIFSSFGEYGFLATSVFTVYRGQGLLFFDAAGSIQTTANGIFVAVHPDTFG